MLIKRINDKSPKISKSAFIAENATVIGDVDIGGESSIWFGAVVRGDSNYIRIGKRTNIQDVCVVHGDHIHSVNIGDDVTVGHRVVLHGCRIGDRVLVGMGAVIMNGAEIGDDSIVGAGALVTENTKIPPHSLVLGMPAKFRRELTYDETKAILESASYYAEYAKLYAIPPV